MTVKTAWNEIPWNKMKKEMMLTGRTEKSGNTWTGLIVDEKPASENRI